MAETVYLAVYDTLADWEYGHIAARITSPQWQLDPDRYVLRTVGRDGTSVITMGGLRIEPELALDELDPQDAAMLVLPGASAWPGGALAPFAAAARELLELTVPVAAICGAVHGLAAEGLLDDRAHTGNSPADLRDSGYAGARHYRRAPVVTDRGVTTAPATEAVAFACEVFTRLRLFPPDVITRYAALFGRG